MTKKKKKLNTKINPEKSNKMIIAVAIGVVIILAAFLLITILSSSNGEPPADKKAFLEKELDYLKSTDGIAALKFYPEQNKVVIVYEAYKEDRHDYTKIAWFAGYKLSRSLKGEEVTVQVAKDSEDHIVHSYTLKDGKQIIKTKKNN